MSEEKHKVNLSPMLNKISLLKNQKMYNYQLRSLKPLVPLKRYKEHIKVNLEHFNFHKRIDILKNRVQ